MILKKIHNANFKNKWERKEYKPNKIIKEAKEDQHHSFLLVSEIEKVNVPAWIAHSLVGIPSGGTGWKLPQNGEWQQLAASLKVYMCG